MSALLPIHRVEKIWGRYSLPAPFHSESDAKIGEIWFDPPEALSGLLVKYLFTSEKLSVQVHPGDSQAPSGSTGKEECWFILDAEPGAKLAIGLKHALSREQLRCAALDGSIEDHLIWHQTRPGDFFYLPAGTIHAIGPGISLIEVQQNADITYRLYDYGRPRELHLDNALRVAKRQSYVSRRRDKCPKNGERTLIDGQNIRLVRIDGPPTEAAAARFPGHLLLIPIEGEYSVRGETVSAGACALVDDIAVISCIFGKALIAQPC